METRICSIHMEPEGWGLQVSAMWLDLHTWGSGQALKGYIGSTLKWAHYLLEETSRSDNCGLGNS